jgi:hypothetical protein
MRLRLSSGLLLVAMLLAVLVAAVPSPSRASGAESGAVATSCDGARPYRLGISPRASGVLVVACGSYDLTQISLTNVSNAVLSVKLPLRTQDWRVANPLALSFTSTVMAMAVSGGCRVTLWCDLPPSSTVFAAGPAWMTLNFEVDYGNSIKLNSARFLGDWISSKMRTPGQHLAQKAAACAGNAMKAAEVDPSRTWEDALRIAITSYSACSSLVSTVTQSNARGERARVARRVVRIGKVFAGGSWVDQLAYAAARILRR